MKPIVYIASPYSKGDPAVNANFQMRVFDELMDDGIVWPVAPLWSHFQHAAFPRPYQDWIDYDLGIIRAFDACLRLAATCDRIGAYRVAESPGADNEAAAFYRMEKPVFFLKDSLYEWAAKWERP